MNDLVGDDLKEIAKSLERYVAVVFYGRSGSVFVQSLLDGHPRVFGTTATHIMHFYDFFDKHEGQSLELMIENFCKHFAVLFDAESQCPAWSHRSISNGVVLGLNKMGPNRDQVLGIDRERFIQSMRYILQDEASPSSKAFLQAVYVSHQFAINKQIVKDPENMMVFPMHDPSAGIAQRILSDFPQAKFLLSVRHPAQALGSQFAFQLKIGETYFNAAWLLMSWVLEGGMPLSEGSDSRAIRLEDLHNDSCNTVQSLGKWLGITWDDCLLESTFDGLQWWNVADAPKVSGFNKVTIGNRHSEYINNFDKLRLVCLTYPQCQKWNYVKEGWQSWLIVRLLLLPCLLLPFKIEMICWIQHFNSGNFSQAIFSLYSICRSYAKGRLLMLKSWKSLFGHKDIVPLVNP